MIPVVVVPVPILVGSGDGFDLVSKIGDVLGLPDLVILLESGGLLACWAAPRAAVPS
jgi:hypothetical protein